MSGPDRPLRADARGNRARILAMAEAVFGEGGESALTEEVARRAGVGIATVFRHFPTKTALLEAVLIAHFERLREHAEALAEDPDPGNAFFDFFAHMVEHASSKLAIAEAFVASGGDPRADPAAAAARLREAIGVLLDGAQRVGAVRDDVELSDVYALLIGASRAAAYAGQDKRTRERTLAVIFDGLRA